MGGGGSPYGIISFFMDAFFSMWGSFSPGGGGVVFFACSPLTKKLRVPMMATLLWSA